ncbi:MAG: hypothetical protein WAQ27_03645 [Candidatus Microsaccharimonas sp.]
MDTNVAQRIIEQNLLIARVITQVSIVEHLIDSIIADYYTNSVPGTNDHRSLVFQTDILSDKYMTIFQKKDILFKVFKRVDATRLIKGDKKAFDDWIHIRNIFAHGKVIHGQLDAQMHFQGQFYDIDKEAQRHAELQRKVLEIIERYPEFASTL